MKAVEIEAELLNMADDCQAAQMLRFFKTGPGQYGEGDKFLGIRNPDVRKIVKLCFRDISLQEAALLVKSPLHEVRLCGLLILVEQYLSAMKKHNTEQLNLIFDSYISLHPNINNWDLVDLSAIKIVGNHELLNPDLSIMKEWINPIGHTLWQQRISMVSTWILIRYGRVEECLNRAEKLLTSKHDLLHKAAGWMLREAWKKGYEEEVESFLDSNIGSIPAVMLSYACEKMHSEKRRQFQLRRKQLL